MPGVELRLADDGEVELRGDCVFAGYRGQEDMTRETFTDDGWLQTGDIGDASTRTATSRSSTARRS